MRKKLWLARYVLWVCLLFTASAGAAAIDLTDLTGYDLSKGGDPVYNYDSRIGMGCEEVIISFDYNYGDASNIPLGHAAFRIRRLQDDNTDDWLASFNIFTSTYDLDSSYGVSLPASGTSIPSLAANTTYHFVFTMNRKKGTLNLDLTPEGGTTQYIALEGPAALSAYNAFGIVAPYNYFSDESPSAVHNAALYYPDLYAITPLMQQYGIGGTGAYRIQFSQVTNGDVNNISIEPIWFVPFGSTHAAKNVTATTAYLSGSIVDDGAADCQCRYHYWAEGGSVMTTDWANIGLANYTLVENLTPGETYSFQIELRNGAGSNLGEIRTFTTQSMLSISSTDGGDATTPGESSYVYNAGTVIDVNAVADLGYAFNGWSGSAVDAGLVTDPNAAATTVQVTGDLSLVANFKLLPKIEWVTETIDIDSNGVQDDQGWIDMLTNAGYYVEVQRDRYTKLGDQKDPNDANDYIGELNAADLVIISRSSSSGNYANDANEITAWNSIQTPLICLSAYHVRSNRLNWVNSSSAVSDNSLSYMSVPDANGPLFIDVNVVGGMVDMVNTLIYGDGYQGTTFVDTTDMGNATVLGSYLLGYPWIAVWQPGVEFYDGAGQVAGGERMMFLAGTQETKSNGIYYPQGAMNLTPDGQKVFLNAVAYMLKFKPEDPGTANLTHQYTFEDGTAADIVGDANGTLFGASYIADGSFVTTDQNDYLSLPGEVVDINSYSAVTLECWYTPEANANPGWSMLASFGNTMSGWKGVDYLFITTARADDISRAAISCLNYSAPWGAENGVNGPEYDDGMLHHMVATVDANEISFYIDGQAMGSTPLDPNNTLSNLSNAEAYLAKSVYGDPQWIGSIQKFSIYDAALSPQEVLYLYLQGD